MKVYQIVTGIILTSEKAQLKTGVVCESSHFLSSFKEIKRLQSQEVFEVIKHTGSWIVLLESSSGGIVHKSLDTNTSKVSHNVVLWEADGNKNYASNVLAVWMVLLFSTRLLARLLHFNKYTLIALTVEM